MSTAGSAQPRLPEGPAPWIGAPFPADVDRIVRQNRGWLLAGLVAALGRGQLARAEAVADGLLTHARESWSEGRPPANPVPWLMAVAQQRLVELLEQVDEDDSSAADLGVPEGSAGRSAAVARRFSAVALLDAELSLLCACCHPALAAPGQAAAILAFSSGLQPAEIAQALQLEPATLHKLLRRARRLLGSSRLLDEAPAAACLDERLVPIQRALRQLRQASTSFALDQPFRDHLRAEAERLAKLVTLHRTKSLRPRPTQP